MTFVLKDNCGFVQSSKERIPYKLSRTKRKKTMEIRINDKAEVNVFAPRFIQGDEVQKFIQQKTSWIIRKVHEIKKESTPDYYKKFVDGEEFLFLGKRYKLYIVHEGHKGSRIAFDGCRIVMNLQRGLTEQKQRLYTKRKLNEWYKNQAEEILGSRIFHYARILNIEPKIVRIKKQKTIWGSCGYRSHSINLNWKIIMAPIEVVDYVIVHELCHIKVPNHSQRFWKEVKGILPDFRERQRWLKKNKSSMKFIDSFN